jgi:glutamyl-Q tRNA(Asp) synthetase
MFMTRFAPSPTGRLHLGHAYSAVLGHDRANMGGGRFLLRIEDLDQTRSRPEFVDGIVEDLRWLGLSWDEPALVQSQRASAYGAALEQLQQRGLVYPCFCARSDIAAFRRCALSRHLPGNGGRSGPPRLNAAQLETGRAEGAGDHRLAVVDGSRRTRVPIAPGGF